jgi:hypothetical protein
VLDDRFERGFSLVVVAFLASFACADIFLDVSFHSRPVVIFGDLLVGVVLSLVTRKGVIVELGE